MKLDPDPFFGSDIHFGEVGAPLPDFPEDNEPDADDEELAETPTDVISMLGFDPKEFSEK